MLLEIAMTPRLSNDEVDWGGAMATHLCLLQGIHG
ncbi:hypothetical protein Fuma_05590 [Fuerstiella marisgermanici]|uniref:Uncharacterized protein n=1 Tax=Fuerstiella marisgermanici TaxID=1891926 RepID=A0A1P8WPD5_9PLAN|nr:hypothetical protein Fuma_05590 [Fuerstiella marisgermanici]